jgi:hypothetical protein
MSAPAAPDDTQRAGRVVADETSVSTEPRSFIAAQSGMVLVVSGFVMPSSGTRIPCSMRHPSLSH